MYRYYSGAGTNWFELGGGGTSNTTAVVTSITVNFDVATSGLQLSVYGVK